MQSLFSGPLHASYHASQYDALMGMPSISQPLLPPSQSSCLRHFPRLWSHS